MKLVVGLGNAGVRYNFTRHNFGFLALDYYLKKRGLVWEAQPKFGAVWARDGETFFVKPQDFYNLSGRAVAEFARYFKIASSDILVVCDNFDLKFGLIRFKARGSAGGNNGLKSIDAALKTSDYARLRLGTENNDERRHMDAAEFVLSRFTSEEKAHLPEILDEAVARIDKFAEKI